MIDDCRLDYHSPIPNRQSDNPGRQVGSPSSVRAGFYGLTCTRQLRLEPWCRCSQR